MPVLTDVVWQGAWTALFPGKLSRCQHYMTTLLKEVRWEQRELSMMGRRVLQPRLICYMADAPELQYTYSGLTVQVTTATGATCTIQ
jgi:hypothetical protein